MPKTAQSDLQWWSKSPAENVSVNMHFQSSCASQPMGWLLENYCIMWPWPLNQWPSKTNQFVFVSDSYRTSEYSRNNSPASSLLKYPRGQVAIGHCQQAVHGGSGGLLRTPEQQNSGSIDALDSQSLWLKKLQQQWWRTASHSHQQLSSHSWQSSVRRWHTTCANI